MPLPDTIRPLHIRSGTGKRLRMITDLITVKATTRDTAGLFALFEAQTPASGGWPPHAQRYDDETLYVLDGNYSVLVGDEEAEMRPGDCVFIPRGMTHAIANLSPAPARMLLLFTPGGVQERFFDQAGGHPDRPAWQPEMSKVLAVAPKYGIEFSAPTPEGGA